MAADFKPGSCDITVDVDNIDLDIPAGYETKWSTACVVEGDVNTAHVHVLAVIDPETGDLVDTHFYTIDDGLCVPLDPALVPLVADCLCAECEEEPQVSVDIELVCNADSGVFDIVETVITDGVSGEPTITPSTIVCVVEEEPVPVVEVDVEFVCDEVAGVYNQITTTTTDGVSDGGVVVATDIPCAPVAVPVIDVDVEFVCDDATGLYSQVVTTIVDGVSDGGVVTVTDLVCDAQAPVIEVDVEFVCNSDTNVFDQITTTIVDGVSDGGIATPTDIICEVDEEPVPVIAVDVEYVCNADTGLFDEVTTTVTDGVSDGGVTVATDIVCSREELPDFEQTRQCIGGFITIVTSAIDADGVVTVVSEVATTEVCDSNETVIANDCGSPVPVATCPDNPLEVTIVDEPVDDVEVDVEFVCNADTGVFDLVEITSVNGVAGAPVTTPTVISCLPEIAPVVSVDVEYVCDEVAGVYNEITTTVVDGVSDGGVVVATDIVCDEEAPSVIADVEYICDFETGFYIQSITVTTDGVTAEPVQTVTDLVCTPRPAPDFEQTRRCIDGTIRIITVAFDANGIESEVSDVDTGETCDEPDKFLECFEVCTVDAFIDNQTNGETPWGSMLWPFYDWEVTVTFSDGSTCVVDHPATNAQGATPTWRENNEQLAASLAAKTGKPWERRGFPLDGDPATPVANHVGVTCCSSDPIPVSTFAQRQDDLSIPPTPLLTGTLAPQISKVWLCRNCDGVEEWRDDDGQIIEKPECLYPCGLVPEVPESVVECETAVIGPVCEIQPGDPDAENPDPRVIESDIYLSFVRCGADELVEAATYPDGLDNDPVLHELSDGNYYGDCDSLDPVTPQPFCLPAGSFSGKSKKVIVKGPWRRVLDAIDGLVAETPMSGTADLSGLLGENVQVSYTDVSANVNGGITAVRNDTPATYTFSGEDICIRVIHGAIVFAGGSDGFTSLDGVPYTFTGGPLIPGAVSTVSGSDYFVTNTTGNIENVGRLSWESDGPATSVQIYAEDGAARFNNGYFVFAATCECVEVSQYVLDCGGSIWVDCDGQPLDIEGLEECSDVAAASPLECAIVDCPAEEARCGWIQDINFRQFPVVLDDDLRYTWTLCGQEYPLPSGSYASFEDFVAATDSLAPDVSASIVGDDILFHTPCDCEAPRLQIVQQVGLNLASSVTLWVRDESNDIEAAEGCALQTIGKNDDRRDDLLEDIRSGKEQCYIIPAETVVVEGSADEPWILVPGELELVRNPGGGGNPGFSNNAAGTIEYSLDGTTFGSFDSILGGQGGGFIVASDPIYVRNAATGTTVIIDITSWTGGGNNAFTGIYESVIDEQSFTCTAYPSGLVECCDALGEVVEFDESWILAECPDLVADTNSLLEQLLDVSVTKIDERCYRKQSAFVDTDNIIDIGGSEPISTPITVIPNETGLANAIHIRIWNTSTIGADGTQAQIAQGIPFTLDIDGVQYPFDQSSVASGPLGPLSGNIPPGRYDVEFPIPAGLQLTAGTPITINRVEGADDDLFWTVNTASDNFQVQPFGSGLYGQLTIFGDGYDCWSECDFTDGTTIIYGPDGSVVEEVPSNANQVRCDKLHDGPEESAIDDVIVDCVGDPAADSAVIGHCGRPNNTVSYEYGGISGATLEEFTENWRAAGYCAWIADFDGVGGGECHWYAPAFPGTDFLVDGVPSDSEGEIVSPNPNPAVCDIETQSALLTVGCADDRRDNLLEQNNMLLQQLLDCMCGDCGTDPGIVQDQRCGTYSNGLTSGYRNWSDLQDLEDLSGEFGILLGSDQIFVRIIEFDCGGAAQPQVGQVFGPYTVPQPNGADAFLADLQTATAGSCLTVGPGPSGGPNGVGSNIAMSFDSTQDSTLVIQEGVLDTAGNVQWFTSAQGFTVRDGQAGDFISSAGNGATSSYAADSKFENFMPAEDCEAI